MEDQLTFTSQSPPLFFDSAMLTGLVGGVGAAPQSERRRPGEFTNIVLKRTVLVVSTPVRVSR